MKKGSGRRYFREETTCATAWRRGGRARRAREGEAAGVAGIESSEVAVGWQKKRSLEPKELNCD